MTDYERRKIIDFVEAMTPEEKEIVLAELEREGLKEDGRQKNVHKQNSQQ